MAGMVIQHSMNAIGANNKMNVNVQGTKKATEKLSSGYQINRAGDNAAGLAISEKMRSQIRGLAQATKNANDGISMIQTYEGALQETHSILQRMKELASQSANGTYQTEVDRDAIESEFKQLNNELDQIADTDFNGVTALNGGQMADGTKAVNGKFDYENNARTSKQLAMADINNIDAQGMDNGAGATSNAAKLWKDLGFDRTDSNLNNDGPDSIDVTFKYDSTSQTWSAISATGGADIKGITVSENPNNGGFQIGSTTSIASPTPDSNLVNVIVDGSTLVNGDTITVTFNNPSVKNTAIENIGVSEADYSDLTVKGTGVNDTSDLTVKVENAYYESTNNGETNAMTADVNKLFNELNGATLKVDYTAAENPATMHLTMTDPDTGNSQTYNLSTTESTIIVGSTAFKAKVTDGKLEITDGTNKLVSMQAAANGADAANQSTGSITYTLAVDRSAYSSATKPSATIAEPANVVSKSNSNNAATAPLTYTDNITLQVGARTKDSVNFTFKYEAAGMGDLKANLNCSSRTDGLGTADLSLKSQKDANIAIDKIGNAINKVSMIRANFGAMQNRLEHKVENLTTTNENLTAAESQIRDTDMATTMIDYTKNNILQQASQAMLAQANQQPQTVLQLLQ